MNADKRRLKTKKASAFIRVHRRLQCVFLAAFSLAASEHHGQVTFGGLSVPGATVTASHGDKKVAVITDPEGKYSFPDIADGVWTIQVEMLCFETVKREITVGTPTPVQDFELKLLPLDQIRATEPPAETAAPSATTATKKKDRKSVV